MRILLSSLLFGELNAGWESEFGSQKVAKWDNWFGWSACTNPCGDDGIRIRSRECRDGQPGEGDCKGRVKHIYSIITIVYIVDNAIKRVIKPRQNHAPPIALVHAQRVSMTCPTVAKLKLLYLVQQAKYASGRLPEVQPEIWFHMI